VGRAKRSAGLITSASSLAFHSWTIDAGPLVESNADIWDEIAAMLGRGKVEAASHALRHHLEYVSRHLADQLGARPRSVRTATMNSANSSQVSSRV
jgi:DNA-binding GntR family transcriptional regulator